MPREFEWLGGCARLDEGDVVWWLGRRAALTLVLRGRGRAASILEQQRVLARLTASPNAFANTLRDDLYAGTTHVGGVETAIPRVIHDHTIVTFFEFSTGLRIRQIKGQKGWHELDATLLGAVAPVVKMPDTEARQKARLFADTISIMHVYDYITALGHASPGCLRQVHVFSHAWLMGPILLDTNERDAYYEGETLSGPRDPLDKDPRCKDFAGGNIADLPAFCGAPSPDGHRRSGGSPGHDRQLSARGEAPLHVHQPRLLRETPALVRTHV